MTTIAAISCLLGCAPTEPSTVTEAESSSQVDGEREATTKSFLEWLLNTSEQKLTEDVPIVFPWDDDPENKIYSSALNPVERNRDCDTTLFELFEQARQMLQTTAIRFEVPDIPEVMQPLRPGVLWSPDLFNRTASLQMQSYFPFLAMTYPDVAVADLLRETARQRLFQCMGFANPLNYQRRVLDESALSASAAYFLKLDLGQRIPTGADEIYRLVRRNTIRLKRDNNPLPEKRGFFITYPYWIPSRYSPENTPWINYIATNLKSPPNSPVQSIEFHTPYNEDIEQKFYEKRISDLRKSLNERWRRGLIRRPSVSTWSNAQHYLMTAEQQELFIGDLRQYHGLPRTRPIVGMFEEVKEGLAKMMEVVKARPTFQSELFSWGSPPYIKLLFSATPTSWTVEQLVETASTWIEETGADAQDLCRLAEPTRTGMNLDGIYMTHFCN